MIRLIIQELCLYYNIDYNYFMSNTDKRDRELVIVRQFITYFLKENTKMTLSQIGNVFGKDHATVLSGIRTIKGLIETDRVIYGQHADLKPRIIKIIEGYNPNYRLDLAKAKSKKRSYQRMFNRKSIVL